jgi:hypothetical protein
VEYVLGAIAIAYGFYFLTGYIFAVVTERNLLHATIWNVALIFVFVAIDKFNYFTAPRVYAWLMRHGRKTVFSRTYRWVMEDVSLKSGMYFYYMAVLVCMALLYADPTIEPLAQMAEYFRSMYYGILILIASDKFLGQVYQDVKLDEQLWGVYDE